MQDLSTTLAELPIPHNPALIPGWEAFRSTAVGLAKSFENEVGALFDEINAGLDKALQINETSTRQFQTVLGLCRELAAQRDAALAEVERLKG